MLRDQIDTFWLLLAVVVLVELGGMIWYIWVHPQCMESVELHQLRNLTGLIKALTELFLLSETEMFDDLTGNP